MLGLQGQQCEGPGKRAGLVQCKLAAGQAWTRLLGWGVAWDGLQRAVGMGAVRVG